MTEELKKPELVLLIDDDEVVNMLNSIILRQSGLVECIRAVQSASEGIEALEIYQRNRQWPAIIFVDINMPGKNGWDFIEMFRESFSGDKQKTVICMLSSSLDPRDKERAIQSDMIDCCLSKPLTAQAVCGIMEKVRTSSGGI